MPFLFFFFLFQLGVQGQGLVLEEPKSKQDVGNFFEFSSVDKEDSEYSDLWEPEEKWLPYKNFVFFFPGRTTPVWLKTSISYLGPESTTFYLRFTSPVMDKFSLYTKHKNGWSIQESGELVYTKDKPIYSHLPSFPIHFNPGETKEIVLRMESVNPIFTFVDILNQKDFLTLSKRQDIFYAAYFGAGFFFFLSSFILARFLRYTQFRYFFLHLLAIILLNMYASGFMQYLEFGESIEWRNYLFPSLVLFSAITGLLFIVNLLEVKATNQKLYQIVNITLYMLLIFLIIHFFLELRIGIYFAIRIAPILLIFGSFLCIYTILKGKRKIHAILLLLACFSILLGTIINTFVIQGFFPPIRFSTISIPIGCAMEVLLMGAALLLRVGRLQKEREEKTEFDIQLRLAQKIQSSLLPGNIKEIQGHPIGFRYIPATNIGGDFLQFMDTNQGIGLFLCDVSGHGIPAALIATMTKVALGIWEENLDKPASSAEKIRSRLKDSLSGHFLTAFFTYINPKAKKIKIANAGHHPMIYLKRNGEIENLTTKGRVLSEYIETNSEEVNFPMPSEGTLILFTDGLTEARNVDTNELYGDERLTKLLKDNAHLPPQSICDLVIESAVRFQKSQKFEDDVTILAFSLEKGEREGLA